MLQVSFSQMDFLAEFKSIFSLTDPLKYSAAMIQFLFLYTYLFQKLLVKILVLKLNSVDVIKRCCFLHNYFDDHAKCPSSKYAVVVDRFQNYLVPVLNLSRNSVSVSTGSTKTLTFNPGSKEFGSVYRFRLSTKHYCAGSQISLT